MQELAPAPLLLCPPPHLPPRDNKQKGALPVVVAMKEKTKKKNEHGNQGTEDQKSSAGETSSELA